MYHIIKDTYPYDQYGPQPQVQSCDLLAQMSQPETDGLVAAADIEL